mmetsp:Transcript_24526/g.76661  ORF Transcript_24526/g.76661 Transcript_24526/m.76661 type:complete len:520 (+) Transcript_24526:446-2005(+)
MIPPLRATTGAGKQSAAELTCIVAATTLLGIGKDGALPWRLKGDMAYFKRVTQDAPPGRQNSVIMGRKTWLSIPPKFRPLPGRRNVVLSRKPDAREALALPPDVACCASLDDAVAALADAPAIFVIGGGEIYEAAVRDPRCTRVLMTRVEDPAGALPACDAFFPDLTGTGFATTAVSPPETENGLTYTFATLARAATPAPPPSPSKGAPLRETTNAPPVAPPSKQAPAAAPNAEEQQYLDLIREILDKGVTRGDRTGTGTRSIFGARMRFSLRDRRFPLLTTKRVFWRGVAEELLWFVAGSTDGNLLAAKNVHIWDGNGSKEFLEKRGLGHREEGDLGPVYGFQWRHFGAAYDDANADYAGKGVDQLAECVRQIKDDPNSRRIVLSAWNPADLDKMALPPCHMFCQFYVADGEVSCQMYQRSADMGLGVPFNIASYALLTRLVARAAGLEAGDFVHVIGDAHVYLNHVDALEEQLKRAPRPFPTLDINPAKTDIDAFEYDDFTVNDYKPYPKIQMDMAV